MRLQILNNSEISTYRQCPKRWGFAYNDKLVSKERFVYFDWGNLYHKGLEILWRNRLDTPRAVELARFAMTNLANEFEEALSGAEYESGESCAKILEESIWALEHYAQVHEKRLAIWEPIWIEHQLNVQMGAGLRFMGTPDLVAFDTEVGDVVIADGKTTAGDVHTFENRLQLDTQSAGYVYAVRKALKQLKGPHSGAHVSGRFVWSVCRKKLPSKPHVNQLRMAKKFLLAKPKMQALIDLQESDGVPRGLVSTKEIDTLPEVYETALEKQETERSQPRTEAQIDKLSQIASRGDSYLQDTETHVSSRQLEQWESDFRQDAKRIRAAKKDEHLRTRNPGACSLLSSPKCAYRWVCIDPDARDQFYEREDKNDQGL